MTREVRACIRPSSTAKSQVSPTPALSVSFKNRPDAGLCFRILCPCSQAGIVVERSFAACPFFKRATPAFPSCNTHTPHSLGSFLWIFRSSTEALLPLALLPEHSSCVQALFFSALSPFHDCVPSHGSDLCVLLLYRITQPPQYLAFPFLPL